MHGAKENDGVVGDPALEQTTRRLYIRRSTPRCCVVELLLRRGAFGHLPWPNHAAAVADAGAPNGERQR